MALGALILFSITLAYRYTFLSYDEILQKIDDLAEDYPHLIRVEDGAKKYDHIPKTFCGNDKPCKHLILKITDYKNPVRNINTLPQVLIIGGLHGDEVMSPEIVAYLAEHLLQNFEKSPLINRLLKNRLIILVPISNPSGYFRYQREEQMADGGLIDANRDFPYNQTPSACLQSAAARVLISLYKEHLIQLAITIHGGDNSLSTKLFQCHRSYSSLGFALSNL